MEDAVSRPSTAAVIVKLASPVFVAVAIIVPVGALIYALNFGFPRALNYVHVMTGALWTGIDLFMGFILGPVLGMMEPAQRAAVFRRLVPRMTFLMPVLAGVTITSGIDLAQRMGLGLLTNTWSLVAIILAAALTIQGFGLLLPNEVRVFRELLSKTPDVQKISRLGMTNAKLGGVQGVLQLGIIFSMASLRF